jgi:hypothetical protein
MVASLEHNVIHFDLWREKELPEKLRHDMNALIHRGSRCEQEIPRRSCDKLYAVLRNDLHKRVAKRVEEFLRGKISREEIQGHSLYLAKIFVDLLREPKSLEMAADTVVYGVGNPWKLETTGGVCLLLAGMFSDPWRIIPKTREIELYINRGTRFYWMLIERIKTLPDSMRGQAAVRYWLSQQHNARYAVEIFANLLYFPSRI